MKPSACLLALALGASLPATAQPAPADATHGEWHLLDQYCTDCHNYEDWAGRLAFDLMAPDGMTSEPRVWESVLRKLRGRLMPPPGTPQPGQAEIDDFVAWVEDTLDDNATRPRAGHVPVQRLNRTEFARAVRDLLAVEIDPEHYLPTEIEVDGFDNIAAALSVSPTFLKQYVGAARHVARLAVGNADARPAVTLYPVSGAQAEFQDGMPLGTRGGMAFVHDFPADGEYRFNLQLNVSTGALESRHTAVLLIDGREVFRGDIGGEEDLALVDRLGPAGGARIRERFSNLPVRVEAGSHRVVLTFIERSRAQSLWWTGSPDDGHERLARIQNGVEVSGPYETTGISRTASRELIFVCEPATAAEQHACAERIAANLARRAFRRPVTTQDLETLMAFFAAGHQEGGFDRGVEHVVAAVLASPHFLYRGFSPDKDIGDSTWFALSDLELASRLSFFLWSQGPDEALLDAAEAGELGRPETLRAQVERMLADPRAAALVENFAMKWLTLDDLDEVVPNPALFPGFSNALREDFAEEARLFIASILLEDRPVTELMTADHSYLNQRLARHYGIDSVFGAQFRRVTLEDEARWGLLGKGAVLMRTSYGDRTSPVLRGNWVLSKLMATPSSPPPPEVETDLSVTEGQKPVTVRALLEQHRANPSCNQCHGVIDPIGLALENFDAVGAWRDVDLRAQEPIDARTVMPGDIPIEGPAELRRELMRRPGQFVQAFTEKLMMYALARELDWFDMPQVRAIAQQAEADDYRLSSIVLGIVGSDAFRHQALPPGADAIAGTVKAGAEVAER